VSETTGDIQAHIRETREDLKANMDELGQKVKSATDWRQHYDKSPGLFLAAALGGGLLVAFATSSRRTRVIVTPSMPAQVPAVPVPAVRTKSAGPSDDSIGVIKTALIGLAASHAKDALAQLLPGFKAQLAEREKSKDRPDVDAAQRPQGNGESMQGPYRANG
jgi:hypothetical protein